MSYYSDSNVETRYLDPRIFVPNSRATFELDSLEAAYLPNLRLCVIGTDSSNIANYNDLVGALSIIRTISLYDGKQELSSINNAQLYRGFLNTNKKNSICESVTATLEGSGLGYSVRGLTNTIDKITERVVTAETPATNESAFLDLREMLPFLNSVTHLPTDLMPNLRLVIEYDVTNQTSNLTTATLNLMRPILACDVITNDVVVNNMNKDFTSSTWLEVEHDRFDIAQSVGDGAAGDQELKQDITVKLNAFNNKRLERLLIVKEIGDPSKTIAADNTVTGFGRFASQGVFRQKYQLRINGQNLYPRANGITGINEMLAHVCDSYSDCFSYIGGTNMAMDTSSCLTNGTLLAGQISYIGSYIGQYINDLQIEYSRTGLADDGKVRPATDRLVGHAYGEVRKQMVIGGPNGYTISYVQ